MTVHIRQAQEADRSQVAALHLASWRTIYQNCFPEIYLQNQAPADLSTMWHTQDITDTVMMLVAEEAGAISGFIFIRFMSDGPFIDNLHVLPGARSRGLGRQLLRMATQGLLALGHGTVYLWVATENMRAIRFYERLGGVLGQKTHKDVFGNALPCFRATWSDLSVILDKTKHSES